MKSRRKIMGSVVLLGLFVAYQASIMSFAHVHFINGVLITHTHPFNDTHSHSQSALVIIGNITLGSDAVEPDVCDIPHLQQPLFAVLPADEVTPILRGKAARVLSLRAPPYTLV